jgi:uncharacterized membrane protein
VVFDIQAFSLVRAALASDALHVYRDLHPHGGFNQWPYPPGYFLWILASILGERASGLSFSDLVQLPPIAADLVIAWLVQYYLGLRAAAERTRLAAAGLVALGPAFAVVSGYHGQIDSIAILPAVLAVIAWERLEDSPRRALAAGLLIGIGATIKTVPLVVLLALLPTVRSPREAATLVGSALALPLLALAPFAIADPSAVEEALRYRGVPGAGGISLLAQPDLSRGWMNHAAVHSSDLTNTLSDYGGLITIGVLLAVGAFLFRRRAGGPEAAALLYLAVWAFGINFFLQYVIWGFPFLLMAGYVRQVAFAQALMLPALVLVYLKPWESSAAAPVYVVASLALWVAAVVGFVLLARRIAQAYPPRPLRLAALPARGG